VVPVITHDVRVQQRHFNFIEPVNSETDVLLWKDLEKVLCDLPLHVNRVEFLHEIVSCRGFAKRTVK
jgi:hypothetical protein